MWTIGQLCIGNYSIDIALLQDIRAHETNSDCYHYYDFVHLNDHKNIKQSHCKRLLDRARCVGRFLINGTSDLPWLYRNRFTANRRLRSQYSLSDTSYWLELWTIYGSRNDCMYRCAKEIKVKTSIIQITFFLKHANHFFLRDSR